MIRALLFAVFLFIQLQVKMAGKLVIIVTGANKGIGFEVVRKLAKEANNSFLAKELGTQGATIYLTARDEARGQAAYNKLANLSNDSTDIQYATLDVSSPDSVRKFKDLISSKHEQVHALINNAGVSPAVAGDGGSWDSKTIEWVLSVNYYGVREMTNAFLPMMHDQGRIVNLSSGLAKLSALRDRRLKERFQKASKVSQVDELMQEFKDGVRDGTYGSKGWPRLSYTVSKVGLVGLTRAFAAEQSITHPKLLVNYVEPGWVTTDMGGGWASDGDAKDGAVSPSFAAVGDLKGKSGIGISKDSKETSW
ncbi:hypothetical protein BDQ12DRAFT_687169 [Crucibulum laeve]|uniref:Carbonyl reductase n=1 Tax=Crucibulum laeve TaxID=68775 RepID=A0A5C3LVY4_9AGAR|nr:hypothetical protein BDQ12DRAFT_687169 [Crucibulum laeve]